MSAKSNAHTALSIFSPGVGESRLPDADMCRRARLSRDARFDGRFYIAVITTRIFCRPVCPAAPPLEKNVRYLATAAEAIDQGFRPCLRCRPETAPNSAAWLGKQALAQRVIVAIEQGQLQQLSVAELAEKMGISERYLRALCQQHAGVSPLALEQARRTLLAKQLVFDSNLAITDIAFAAGYHSVRRFNEHWRQQFNRAPSEMRKADNRQKGGEKQALQIRLPVAEEYDFYALLSFFRLRQLPLIERIDQHSYRRCVSFEDSLGGLDGLQTEFEVRYCAAKSCLLLTVEADALVHLNSIILLVKRLFDVDAPLQQIMADLHRDPLLTQAWRDLTLQDLRLPGVVTPFEAILRAIIGQQVSVKAAITLLNRLLSRFYNQDDVAKESSVLRAFPLPQQLVDFDFDGLGLLQTRVDTLKAVVAAFCQYPEYFAYEGDAQLRAQTLLAIKGIGPWTVNYMEMRAYAQPDAFVAADLIVCQSYQALAGLDKRPTAKNMEAYANDWQPWRAYATLLLWQYSDHLNRADSKNQQKNA